MELTTQDKPEQLQFWGTFTIQNFLRCGSASIRKRVGEPCGTLRWGVKDAPVWLADRVLGVPYRQIPFTTWYTVPEASRYVGVSRIAFLNVVHAPLACVTSGRLYGRRCWLVKPLWSEPELNVVRRKIADGSIAIQPRSLTRRKWQSWGILA
jgi:hypothetical protein